MIIEGGLEELIVHEIERSSSHLLVLAKTIGETLGAEYHIEQFETPENLSDTYKTINLSLYEPILDQILHEVNIYSAQKEELHQEIQIAKRNAAKNIRQSYSELRKFSFKEGSSFNEFVSMNRGKKQFKKLDVHGQKGLWNEFKQLARKLEEVYEEESLTTNLLNEEYHHLDYVIESTNRLIDLFDLMNDLNLKEPNFTEIETNNILKSVLKGTLEYKVAGKLLFEKKVEIPKNTLSLNRISFSSGPKIDEDTVQYLRDLGFKRTRAESLSRHKDIDGVLDYISDLESIFQEYGLPEKEFKIALHTSSKIILDKDYRQNYLNTVTELYATVNPNSVSGILPSKNKSAYKNSIYLKKLIPKPKNNLVEVEGLELITKESHKHSVEEHLKLQPFYGDSVMRFGGKQRKNNPIYQACLALTGEDGIYRKIKISGTRVLVKVNTEKEPINVQVIAYFERHEDYEKAVNI